MNNKLRQNILKEIKNLLNEVENASLEQKLRDGSFTPNELLQYVTELNKSSYIDDQELQLAANSAVMAGNKCSKPSLTPEETQWCESFKNLATQIRQLRVNTFFPNQGRLLRTFYDNIDKITKIQKTTTETPANQTLNYTPYTPMTTSTAVATNFTPGEQTQTNYTPNESEGQNKAGEIYAKSFTCKDVEAVKIWQKYLKVYPDGKIGIKTLTAAKNSNSEIFSKPLSTYMGEQPEAEAQRQNLCSWLTQPQTKEFYMNNLSESLYKKDKLRQQILNELNFILREQIEPPSEAGGTGMMSEDLDDIVEDINDSDKENIAGHSFLNLTNFGDETDEGEIAKLISFAKTIEKQEDLTDQKTLSAFNKICEIPLLLINRAGPVDTFFYVSCRKIGNLNVPFSVRKLVDEGDEAALTMAINKVKGMPVLPVGTPKECPDKSEPIENLPDGTKKCKDGTIIKPDASPTPALGKYPQGSMKCKKCSDIDVGCTGPDVAEIQKALAQKVPSFAVSHPEISSQTFGQVTAEAVIKFKESGKFLNPPFTPKVGPSTAKALGIKCGSGGGGSKKSSETKSSAKPDSSPGSITTGIQYKCPTGQNYVPGTGKCSDGSNPTMVKESKNFYDNKKLIEAKQLFNKLMKNL